MCNLYNLKVRRWEIDDYFQTYDQWRDQTELEKDYVAPGRPGLVIRAVDGQRKIEAMRWGFPPPPGVAKPIVNVRNYSSPFWRTALKNPDRRCLVPVTEFQEWSLERDPATGKHRCSRGRASPLKA